MIVLELGNDGYSDKDLTQALSDSSTQFYFDAKQCSNYPVLDETTNLLIYTASLGTFVPTFGPIVIQSGMIVHVNSCC